MSIGDKRQCGFCLKEYIVTATNNNLAQCCRSCAMRHLRSKQGLVKKGIHGMSVSLAKKKACIP